MKRFTDTETFDDRWFQSLPLAHKCFWKYVTEKCDSTGVWKENLPLAEFLIGESLTHESLLKDFEGRIEVHRDGYWFLPKFIPFQYGMLKETCNPHKSILKLLRKHLENGVIPLGFVKDNVTLPTTLLGNLPSRLQEQEQEEEQVKDNTSLEQDSEIPPKHSDPETTPWGMTLPQIIEVASQMSVASDVAEAWWHSRAGNDPVWTQSRATGSSSRITAQNYRSNLKSFANIYAQNNQGKNRPGRKGGIDNYEPASEWDQPLVQK